MKTLYLFPTVGEAEGLLSRCPNLREQIAIIGVGMAEAGASAAVLIARHKPRRVVLCGIAGACDRRLGVGDVVAVIKDRVAGLPAKYSKDYEGALVDGLCCVQSFTVSRTGETAALAAEDLPAIEQMEGAAVAAACRAFGVEEYIHLRAISNYIDDPRAAWRIAEAVEALGAQVAVLKL